jgi:hypothetical protein
MSLSGVNAGYLDVRNAILRVGTLDVQTIVSGVDTATNIAKTNTILLWDDQGSDMNSPPFILTSATRSTDPPHLELAGGVAHVGIKLPNAWLGAFEVYMSNTTDGSIKLHTYTTDTTTYGDTGYELVLDTNGVTLNYDGTQVATAAFTWVINTWHQVVVGFERGAWTVSVDGTPTLIKDDIERTAVYANVGQYLRLDASAATTTKRVRYVKFAANGHWLQSNTGALSYTQGNVGIGVTDPARRFHVRGETTVWRLDRDRDSAALHMHRFPTGDWTTPWKGYALGVNASDVDTGEFFIGDYGTAVSSGQTRRLTIDNTGNVIIGTQTTGSHLLEVYGTANTGALTTTSTSVTDATQSTSKDTGALVVTQGGLGVESNIHSTNVFAASHVGVGTTATTYALDVNGTTNVGAITMQSNVYAPNLQVAPTAANLVTWNSATGDFMDSGGLISNKLAIVSEQPPAALTGATTVVDGHGRYKVTSSFPNTFDNYEDWRTFNKANGAFDAWTGAIDGFSTVSPYAYTGDASLGGISGEWVQLELPYKTKLRHISLQRRNTANVEYNMPSAFSIIGSNDDSNWTTLSSFSGLTANDYTGVQKQFIINATEQYKYYAIVVTNIVGNAGLPRLILGEWRLFTESFSVDGGIVSTTAASGLDVGYTEHPVEPMANPIHYVEGHGTYEASASSYDPNNLLYPWYAFDYGTTPPNRWSVSTSYYSTTGAYTGTISTSDIGGTRHLGQWLQIKLPYVITLSKIKLLTTTTLMTRAVTGGTILGSSDGTNWYVITTFSGISHTQGEYATVDTNATTPYQYYRLVVKEVPASAGPNRPDIAEWRLFAEKSVTRMENVHISGALSSETLQTSHIKWPKMPLKANESEGYVASASSADSGAASKYTIFNDLFIGQNLEYWDSASTYSTSTGAHDNSVSTTDASGVVHYGEWVQIKLTSQIVLHSMKWYPRTYYSGDTLQTWPLERVPKSGTIMGSNDGVVWHSLRNFAGISYTTDSYETGTEVEVESQTPYLYYRLVITSLNAGTNSNRAGLMELQLFESTVGVGTSATTAKLTVEGGLGLAKGSQVFAGSDVVMELPRHERPLTKYPEVAMTANSSGGYSVDFSSRESATHDGFKAFNDLNGTNYTTSFTTGFNTFTDGIAAISRTTGNDTFNHEWIQLNLPKPIHLEEIDVYRRGPDANNANQPKSGRIYGSNDGNTFDLLFTYSGLTYNGYTTPTKIQNPNTTKKYYNRYRFVITEMYTGDRVSIGEMDFWGYEEGDTSVDVVHRSIPNTPGQQQLAVYWDANDSASYSFADSSNVYDLSGNGVKGTLTGGVGFDPEYNAFTFDGGNITGDSNSTAGNWIHTMSTWIYFNSLVTGTVFRVNPNSYVYGGHNEVSAFFARSSGFIWDFGMQNNNTTTLKPVTNRWYHVTLVADGSGYKKIYIDNELQTSFSYSNNTNIVMQTNAPLDIGVGYLDGSIANFRLYSKALNADQVRELYEYDAGRFGHRQNLVALHKGNLGVGVAHPTARFEVAGADGLQEYPPKAMTGYETYIEGHGVFKVSASSLYNASHPAHNAFNGLQDGISWISGEDSYNSDGTATGASAVDTFEGVAGSWVGIQLPNKITVQYIIIKNRDSSNIRNAEAGILWGKRDNATWYRIKDFSGLNTASLAINTIIVKETTAYDEYRLQITEIVPYGGVGEPAVSIGELELYGTPAPSSLEDGHLTLGKALTLPRVSGHGAGAETPRVDSLVVHYDTTVDSVVSGTSVVDISGQGNNGTLTNGAAYSSTDRAFTFDGVDDYVIGTLNNPSGAWAHSISFWIQGGVINNKIPLTIGTDGAGSSDTIGLHITGSSLNYYFYANDKIFTYTTNNTTLYHIVATYDGGSTIAARRLWVNGVEITTYTTGGTIGALNLGANAPLYLGRRKYATGSHVNGSISNFKIWGGVALTAEEVAQEYALGRTGKSLNLTDTALCLGGTVPRAQLDVRGVARFDGRVGIGTANPLAQLHIGPRDNDHIYLASANNDYGWKIDTDDQLSGEVPFRIIKRLGGTDTTVLTIKNQNGNVGIGYANPSCPLDFGNIVQNKIISLYGSTTSDTAFYGFGVNDATLRYNTLAYSEVHKFYGGSTEFGYINDATGFVNSFTGQHKSFPHASLFGKTSADLCGLIVSASGEYISINDNVPQKGQGAIQVSEAIPTVKLSVSEKDKKVFGVVSDVEDVESAQRHDHYGAFVSTFEKERGDSRIYVNSIGEGAIWVVNTAGSLESGDYITTSNVAGYGQRQESEFLANYTVAKITMDCDFNPPDIPVQRIVKELSNITYWYQLEDATSNAYDRTVEETYYTKDRRVEVHGYVDEQSNVFVEPEHDLRLYTKTQENVVSEEVYEALPVDEQGLYDSNTFTYTQVIEISPEVWDDLGADEQNTYVHHYYDIVTDEVPEDTPGAVERTRTLYKKLANETKVEPATPEDYFSEVRDEWVNVLDAHGQLQWEDVPWGETEPAYKIRYLDADGAITTRHNEVYRAAFVGVTYHCG